MGSMAASDMFALHFQGQGGEDRRKMPLWQRAGGTHPTGMHSCFEI